MAETKLEVLGRYKILEVIGRGAMGVVYKAVDPVIDRIVAIKTINLTLSKEDIQEYDARLRRRSRPPAASAIPTSSRSTTSAAPTKWPTWRWSSSTAAS
jgi:serine/threonine protein kinase